MPSNKNPRRTPPLAAVEVKKEKDASPPALPAEPDGPRTHQGAGKGKRVMVAPPGMRGPGGEIPDPAQLAAAADAIPPVPIDASGDVKMEDAATQNGAATKDPFPLVIGTDIDCRWRDNQHYRARVIERRQLPDSDKFEYYMHYLKFNRRMDEWVKEEQLLAHTAEPPEVDADGKQKKRKTEEPHDEEHAEFDAKALREHEEYTKVKNVERIELGRYEMETWYFSPLPAEYKDCKKLYFAEYDLMFFKKREHMLRHLRKTRLQHPPGDEIYRKGNISMFEVDGKKEKIYCQNLCYLAKLFLDHKTLYYDVDLFLFYVLCECDERGAHIVGYFSKEKCSEEGYNLACILTLPCYQRKGYGKFLIAMSYELSKIEGKVGTPERPLSDLGNVSYRGYWTRELLKVLVERQGGDKISIKELADVTAIKTEDVISTLQYLNLIQYDRGQHVIIAAPHIITEILKKAGSPGLQVDPSKIVWTPYNAEREYANYRN